MIPAEDLVVIKEVCERSLSLVQAMCACMDLADKNVLKDWNEEYVERVRWFMGDASMVLLKPDGMMTGSIGRIHGWEAARVEDEKPCLYRLCIKSNRDLVLQGAYKWTKGIESGIDWKDIPTEVEK